MLTRTRLHHDNYERFAALRVSDAQEPLIARNDDWLLEAGFVPSGETWGLSFAGEAVGLYSLLDPATMDGEDDHFQPGCLYLWRLMIDRRYQRRGHGAAAIALILADARSRGFAGLSLTTMDRQTGNALGLYQRLHFVPTGRRLDGEIELVLRFADP